MSGNDDTLLNVRTEQEKHRRVLFLDGDLTNDNAPAFMRTLDQLQIAYGEEVILDLDAVGRLDSSGCAVILEARDDLSENGVRLALRGGSDSVRKIFSISTARAGEFHEETHTFFWNPIAEAGEAALRAKGQVEALVMQAGEVAFWLLVAPFARKPVRWREAIRQAGLIGADAVPIVALISLLVGVIMGMQAAQQLRQFGATIFVADLVGISATRELGPLMTAIVVAGRSGSSIAAELGSMSVSEEIDALKTMGLNPTRYLVVPRLLALLVVMPCLVMIADAVAIFGGFLVGTVNLGLGPATYINQTIQALFLSDVITGLIKAVVFGAVIGNVAVYQGLQVRGGSEGVGQATTASVVASILLVIIADALFTALFYVYA